MPAGDISGLLSAAYLKNSLALVSVPSDEKAVTGLPVRYRGYDTFLRMIASCAPACGYHYVAGRRRAP